MHAPSAFTNASGATLDVLLKECTRLVKKGFIGSVWGGYELIFNLNNTCLPLSNTSPRLTLKT